MEPSTIAAALAAGTQATTLLKNLVDRIKAMGKAEVSGDFIELQSAMMELQQRQQDLVNRLREVEDENRSLRDAAELESKITYSQGVYFIKESGNRDGTYCQVCWDTNRKLIRLTHFRDKHGSRWSCRVCDHDFLEKGYDRDE